MYYKVVLFFLLSSLSLIANLIFNISLVSRPSEEGVFYGGSGYNLAANPYAREGYIFSSVVLRVDVVGISISSEPSFRKISILISYCFWSCIPSIAKIVSSQATIHTQSKFFLYEVFKVD